MVGGVCIAAVFLFYLLSGFGLFTLVSLSGFSWAHLLIGVTVAVVLGVISVLDVLRNRDEFILAIPPSKKEQIERYISSDPACCSCSWCFWRVIRIALYRGHLSGNPWAYEQELYPDGRTAVSYPLQFHLCPAAHPDRSVGRLWSLSRTGQCMESPAPKDASPHCRACDDCHWGCYLFRLDAVKKPKKMTILFLYSLTGFREDYLLRKSPVAGPHSLR